MSRSKIGIHAFMLTVIVLAFSFSGLQARPALAQEAANRVIVNTGALNIRSGPSVNTAVLGTVWGGTELAVTGRNPGTTWWRVESAFGTGWVSAYYVVFRGVFDAVPVVAEPAGMPEIPTAIVNTGRLNVRGGPGVEYAVLTSVPGGTKMAVTGRHPTLPWMRVEGDFGVGWVRILYTIFRGDWNVIPRVTEPVGSP